MNFFLSMMNANPTKGKINTREGGSWRFLPPPNTAKRIMLPNEVFALACRAYYDEIGLVVDARNGEFAHCPYPEGMGETGYYLLHDHHQQQGLLQSRDIGKLCFFMGDVKSWLVNCSPLPDDYFGLWDIYDEFASGNGRAMSAKVHAKKDEYGKSLHAKRAGEAAHSERNREGKSLHALELNKKLHANKDVNGKSLAGVRAAKAANSKKDETGKSAGAVKGGKLGAAATNEAKDENGKSVNAVKGAKETNSQIWVSTVDDFRSSAAGVAHHNKANGWDPKAKVRVEAS